MNPVSISASASGTEEISARVFKCWVGKPLNVNIKAQANLQVSGITVQTGNAHVRCGNDVRVARLGVESCNLRKGTRRYSESDVRGLCWPVDQRVGIEDHQWKQSTSNLLVTFDSWRDE